MVGVCGGGGEGVVKREWIGEQESIKGRGREYKVGRDGDKSEGGWRDGGGVGELLGGQKNDTSM